MTALTLSRTAYAMLWLAVAGWELLLVLELLGDLDRRWPVAVFAFVMALMMAWTAVQWRAWMSAGREWPRVGLPMAAVMLLLPCKVLSVEMGG
jgi:hypothetical protein